MLSRERYLYLKDAVKLHSQHVTSLKLKYRFFQKYKMGREHSNAFNMYLEAKDKLNLLLELRAVMKYARKEILKQRKP